MSATTLPARNVRDASIDTADLKDAAVTPAKIAASVGTGKLLYVHTGTASGTRVTNTTTDTTYGWSFTIPANTLIAGDVIRIAANGIARSTGSPTLKNSARINSTGYIVPTVTVGPDETAARWCFHIDLTFRSIGASSVVNFSGFYACGSVFQTVSGVSTGDDGFLDGMNSGVDTTADIVIDFSGKWSAAATGNSSRIDGLNASLLRA